MKADGCFAIGNALQLRTQVQSLVLTSRLMTPDDVPCITMGRCSPKLEVLSLAGCIKESCPCPCALRCPALTWLMEVAGDEPGGPRLVGEVQAHYHADLQQASPPHALVLRFLLLTWPMAMPAVSKSTTRLFLSYRNEESSQT